LVIAAMLIIPQIQYAKSKNKEQYYEGTVDLEEN
jgi:putative transport protein sgaT protein